MQVHFTYDVEIWIDGWTAMGPRLPAGSLGWAGRLLDRYGVKAEVRRLIREHG